MTTRASAKTKNKKPLLTTLGKAPICYDHEESIDLSHIRKPINTTVFGLREVLSLFETATDEVRKYVAYECDILYECRICRTIFRSLANFVLHKRNYCRESFTPAPSDHKICRDLPQETRMSKTPKEAEPKETAPHKNINIILKKLIDKQKSTLITKQALEEDLSVESCKSTSEQNNERISLEPIESSKVGVFQTVFPSTAEEPSNTDFMKSEVMEIHGILDSAEAILGPTGKIISFEKDRSNVPKRSLFCTVCNQKFSTKKTLTYHIRYKHNESKLIYPCPECKEIFSNAWCVFRHLYKVHRKSSTQVRKMREEIHASAIKREQESGGNRNHDAKTYSRSGCDVQERRDLDNQQWMDDIEGDNDLQMCGGCGRRFERKAALHSHSQTCIKRIAVCNIIKENNAKRAQEDEKPTTNKPSQSGSKPFDQEINLKGSSRRKACALLKNYKVLENAGHNKTPKIVDINPDSDMEILSFGDETGGCSDDSMISEEAENAVLTSSMIEKVIGLTRMEDTKEYSKAVKNDDKQEAKISSLEAGNSAHKSNLLLNQELEKVANIAPINPRHTTTDNMRITRNHTLKLQHTSALPEDVKSPHIDEAREAENSEQASEATTKSSPTFSVDVEIYNQLNLDIKETITEIASVCTKKNHASSFEPNCSDSTIHEEEDRTPEVILETKALGYMDVGTTSCIPCSLTFNSMQELLCHMALHFSWYNYKCAKCTFKSYKRSSCASHAEEQHQAKDSNVDVVLTMSNAETVALTTEFIGLISGTLKEEFADLSNFLPTYDWEEIELTQESVDLKSEEISSEQLVDGLEECEVKEECASPIFTNLSMTEEPESKLKTIDLCREFSDLKCEEGIKEAPVVTLDDRSEDNDGWRELPGSSQTANNNLTSRTSRRSKDRGGDPESLVLKMKQVLEVILGSTNCEASPKLSEGVANRGSEIESDELLYFQSIDSSGKEDISSSNESAKEIVTVKMEEISDNENTKNEIQTDLSKTAKVTECWEALNEDISMNEINEIIGGATIGDSSHKIEKNVSTIAFEFAGVDLIPKNYNNNKESLVTIIDFRDEENWKAGFIAKPSQQINDNKKLSPVTSDQLTIISANILTQIKQSTVDDTHRPIRNRVPTVREEFVYDMKLLAQCKDTNVLKEPEIDNTQKFRAAKRRKLGFKPDSTVGKVRKSEEPVRTLKKTHKILHMQHVTGDE